jgi:uncharacterized protein
MSSGDWRLSQLRCDSRQSPDDTPPVVAMKFNVSQLMKERVGATRSYTFEGEPVDLGEPFGTEAFDGEVRLTRTNRSIVADARVAAEATGECGRCLEPARFPLRLTIAEEFFPTIDVFTGTALPVPADGFRIDHNHILDLSDAVRQYSLTAVPMAPLCRPDCAGLCPQCGANRNEVDCGCREDVINPQLAALAAWRDENDEILVANDG